MDRPPDELETQTCYAENPHCDCATYTVEQVSDTLRLIRDRGKFEGECPHVVHFWNLGMEGFADEEYHKGGVGYWHFHIRSTDLDAFPELNGTKRLTLYEDSQGFVRSR